jgi:hypothetical protein
MNKCYSQEIEIVLRQLEGIAVLPARAEKPIIVTELIRWLENQKGILLLALHEIYDVAEEGYHIHDVAESALKEIGEHPGGKNDKDHIPRS